MTYKLPYSFLHPFLNAPLMGRDYDSGYEPIPPDNIWRDANGDPWTNALGDPWTTE